MADAEDPRSADGAGAPATQPPRVSQALESPLSAPGLLDDADVDLSFAGPEPVVPTAPWYARWLDLGSAYLPLLLMASLAAATWWLVQATPTPDVHRDDRKTRHEPDYVMQRFVVNRYAADGSLKTRLTGVTLRHYPDNDTLEVDDARIESIAKDGVVTTATARRALANGDGSEVQLLGDARIVRPAVGKSPETVFTGEFFHAFRNTEVVQSHLPVVMTQGQDVVHAQGGMHYDHLARIADLKGPTRATLTPPQPARSAASAAARR